MDLEPSGEVCSVIILIKGRILPFDHLSPVDGIDVVGLFPRDLALGRLGRCQNTPEDHLPGERRQALFHSSLHCLQKEVSFKILSSVHIHIHLLVCTGVSHSNCI